MLCECKEVSSDVPLSLTCLPKFSGLVPVTRGLGFCTILLLERWPASFPILKGRGETLGDSKDDAN